MVEEIVCAAPLFDEVTEYTFEESRDLIEYASKKKVKVYDLPNGEAIREKVETALREHPNALFYHTDHGSPDRVWGDDERPVLDLENVDLLKGRETVQNNCSSAKKLGIEAYKRGCKAYWGSKDVVSFTTDAWESFKEAFLFGLKRRIDGLSWKECLKKTKERMTELVDELLKAGKVLAASCMRRDRDILVCYNTHPPKSDCRLRSMVVDWFGPQVGWRITKKFPFAIALFFLGFGIALGKLTHTLWEIGGIWNVLALQGDYVGYGLMLAGFLLAYYQIWVFLQRFSEDSGSN